MSTENKKWKILIADDHPVFRHGLKTVIQTSTNYEVIAEAENGHIAVQLTKELDPDVVIMDIDMPELDGISAAREITALQNDVSICFLTLHKDRQIFKSMKLLGVRGYLLKDSALTDIFECLDQLVEKKVYVSSGIVEMMLESSIPPERAVAAIGDINRLTPTEIKILKLISTSITTRKIAEQLFVSVRTVETHRFNICSKLGIHGNHALLKYALSNIELIMSINENK